MRSLPVVLAVGLFLGAPATAQLHFTNVADQVGLASIGFGRGAAWDDFDGDGLLDVFVLKGDEPIVVYRQKPDHTFTDVTAAWGIVPQQKDHWSCVAADFDNDGDDDVFVGVGGFFGPQTNLLYRNDLDTLGRFTDVSGSAGSVTTLATPVFGSLALDRDEDGDLDVFTSDVGTDGSGHCHLFNNNGNLKFSNVSTGSKLYQLAGDYRDASTGDFNADGLIDIGVGNFLGNSRLYRNEGNGTFTNVAPQASPQLVAYDRCFGLILQDFNLDGWDDIYLPRYQFTPVTPSGLFHNLKDGTFADDSISSGMTGQSDMGHNTADLDDDGYFEIWIGTGAPPMPYLDVLLRCTPDASGALHVSDITQSSGITAGGPTRQHGTVFGDYDGDGDIDAYCNDGGMGKVPTSVEPNVLFRNDGNSNHWVEIALRGTISNRSAIGALSVAKLPDGRAIPRRRSAGQGFGNSDSPVQHFGLGANTSVESIEIHWPSGITQTLLDPAIETRHAVVETGLRMLGAPHLGTTVTVEDCGPSGSVSEMLMSFGTGAVSKPKFGGVLQVTFPLVGPIPVVLDAGGLQNLPLAVPLDASLVGVSLYLQSWTHAPGATSGGTLTNLLSITIE